MPLPKAHLHAQGAPEHTWFLAWYPHIRTSAQSPTQGAPVQMWVSPALAAMSTCVNPRWDHVASRNAAHHRPNLQFSKLQEGKQVPTWGGACWVPRATLGTQDPGLWFQLCF